MPNNDLQLYGEARGGDIKAFEVLFRRYYSPLCSYAFRYTKSSDYSEELVQELFFVLWRDRADIQINHSVKSYMFEAVRNRALHYIEHLHVRERYRFAEKINQSEATSSCSPEADAEAKDVEQRMSEILLQFPDRRRRIFYMHRFGGFKYAEIAEKLMISIKTVEAEMHKALKAFKLGLVNN